MDAKISINDIKLRQNLNQIFSPVQSPPLRLTRLSKMDIYEHIIYLNWVDMEIPLSDLPDYEKRFIAFAQDQFKNRN
jgi:hypothetical protein